MGYPGFYHICSDKLVAGNMSDYVARRHTFLCKPVEAAGPLLVTIGGSGGFLSFFREDTMEEQWKIEMPEGWDGTVPAGAMGRVANMEARAGALAANEEEMARQARNPNYKPKLVPVPPMVLEGEPVDEPEEEEDSVEESAEPSPVPEVKDDSPAPSQGRTVPSGMRELAAMLGRKHDSKYDFGIRTIPPAGPRVKPEGALAAMERNMMLCVCRALRAKKFGVEFTADEVRESARNAWKGSLRLEGYKEALRGMPPAVLAEHIKKIEQKVDSWLTEEGPGKLVAIMRGRGWTVRERGWNSRKKNTP